MRAHVGYLGRHERQGQQPEAELVHSADAFHRASPSTDEKSMFYERTRDAVDGQAITANWGGDNRHFRLIVSAEDGAALGDLRPFIREVIDDLEKKLGTRLEWLAIDHRDTDNPHSHVIIRGRCGDGEDLFIPSRLISSGIRQYAQEVATRVLGPRLESDLKQDLWAEISRVGRTVQDSQLIGVQHGHGNTRDPDLVVSPGPLETPDLTARERDGWRLADNLAARFKAMEDHHAIEQTIEGTRRPGELLPLLAADPRQEIEGELVHFGPTDEGGANYLAVIETGRGELRYAHLTREEDLVALKGAVPGAIVSLQPHMPAPTQADDAIAAIAERTGGLYSAEAHLEQMPHVSLELIQSSLRRLEAMRLISLVSSETGGVFRVGRDFLRRAAVFDERLARRYPLAATAGSYLGLRDQVRAIGSTRLDRVLAAEIAPPQGEGPFARRYAAAVQQRLVFLLEQGWMRGRILAPAELAAMSQRERHAAAGQLEKDLGKPVFSGPLNRVSGLYLRHIDLAQGRMAVIDAGRHAVLVDWRPEMERFAGREIEGAWRGQGLAWSLSRGRELGLGLGR